MKLRVTPLIAGAVLMTAAGATGVSVTSPPTVGRGSPGVEAHTSSGMLVAFQRDFGLSESQARSRLNDEAKARQVGKALRASLGESYGGTWFDPRGGKQVVAVSDPAKADQVRAAGGEAKVVRHSHKELDDAKTRLDRKAHSTPPGAMGGVTSWYVDQVNNSLTIEVNKSGGDPAATERFISAAKANSPAVRVVEVTRSPRPLEDLRGGDPWYGSNFRCSVGFSAVGRDGSPHMLTAGHCVAHGGDASGYNRVPLGVLRDSVFDNRGDYGDIAVTSSQWALRPWVNTYGGGNVTVTGSMEAEIGDAVCRSGSTTGWHCGVVQDTYVSVVYPKGVVRNLTMTDVCAEPGDSGGAWVSGDQAQGMTSGGTGNCTSGGTTYFSPVNQALNDFGLRLVTG